MSSTPATARAGRVFTMHDARAALIGLGVFAASVGGLILLNDIPPRQYPAIVAWLVIALLVHDVLIAGLVFAAALLGRRAAAGHIPAASIVIVQCALAVGAIVVLIVVPEIVKAAAGTANPSILPLDYTANLAIFLAALAAVTVAAVVLHTRLARRERPHAVGDPPE